MPPDARGIWTPRQTTKFFRKGPQPFKALAYKPPKPPRRRITVEECMSPEGADMLHQMALTWREEAQRIELSVREPTLEEKIGDILLTQDLPLSTLTAQWDIRNDGLIFKAEFRKNVWGLGVKAKYQDVDELFEQYDADHSDSLDIEELHKTFAGLKEAALEIRRYVDVCARGCVSMPHSLS
jgi:hypothetical protein